MQGDGGAEGVFTEKDQQGRAVEQGSQYGDRGQGDEGAASSRRRAIEGDGGGVGATHRWRDGVENRFGGFVQEKSGIRDMHCTESCIATRGWWVIRWVRVGTFVQLLQHQLSDVSKWNGIFDQTRIDILNF